MKYLIPLLIINTAAIAQEEPQSKCADAGKLIQFLAKDYGEIPFAEFTTNAGTHLLMFVSPKTSTYTVVSVENEDTYCGVSAGKDFKPANQKDYEKYKDKDTEKPKTPL